MSTGKFLGMEMMTNAMVITKTPRTRETKLTIGTLDEDSKIPASSVTKATVVTVQLVPSTIPVNFVSRTRNGALTPPLTREFLHIPLHLALLLIPLIVTILRLLMMAALCTIIPDGQAVLLLKLVLPAAPSTTGLLASADLPTRRETVLNKRLLVGILLFALSMITLLMIILPCGTR